MEDKFLTPAQIAEKLQVHEKTVHRWLNSGDLKGFKLGRFWRVKEAEFETFLQHQSQSN